MSDQLLKVAIFQIERGWGLSLFQKSATSLIKNGYSVFPDFAEELSAVLCVQTDQPCIPSSFPATTFWGSSYRVLAYFPGKRGPERWMEMWLKPLDQQLCKTV